MISKSRARRTALMVLLETIPPVFNVALVSGLTFLTFKHHIEDRSGWILAVSTFVVLQLILNWIQFLRYKASVPTSTKNFPGYVHRFPSLTCSKDARQVNEEFEAMRSTWKECEACDMHVPLLSHHCSHCRKCIYALDHHCYFLGHCVGRANQRYFIVFVLYAAIGSAIGVWNIYQIMREYRNVLSHEVAYYLFPFTSIMYFLGSTKAWEVWYVCLFDLGLGAWMACTFFFLYGMKKVLYGDPRHAESVSKSRRKQPTRNEFTRIVKIRYDDEKVMSKCEKFINVFGTFGFLHFVCPFLPFGEESVTEPGYRRIVTYNNDYILNGVVHTSEQLLS